jgi:hypothetical protein
MDESGIDCDVDAETDLEVWLTQASRDELVQRIRENGAREQQRYDVCPRSKVARNALWARIG